MQRELDRQARERDFDRVARVAWLLDQLDNYVERWIGMVAAAEPARPSVEDDLFHMIEIGAEAVSAELHSLESPIVADRWRGFLSAVAAGGARAGSFQPVQLTTCLAAVRSALSTSLQTPERNT